jgi:hypothetical protein
MASHSKNEHPESLCVGEETLIQRIFNGVGSKYFRINANTDGVSGSGLVSNSGRLVESFMGQIKENPEVVYL